MSCQILGVRFHWQSIEQIHNTLRTYLAEGRQRLVVTVNPEFLVEAVKLPAFRYILNVADLRLVDGFGIVLAGCILGCRVGVRYTGVDAVHFLAKTAATEGYRVYMLGASPGVAHAAATSLRRMYPGLHIDADCGPQSTDIDANVDMSPWINKVNAFDPTILLVAFGHPKQEFWLSQHLASMPGVRVAMGVGGTLDYISGRVRRAPAVMRALGLEWLYRLVRQPWRVVRIYRALVVFLWLVLRQRFNQHQPE